MEKRHFVVHITENDYSLKEITAEIAESMSRYGMIRNDYHRADGQEWAFYFMNTALTTQAHRHTIIEKLVEGILPTK